MSCLLVLKERSKKGGWPLGCHLLAFQWHLWCGGDVVKVVWLQLNEDGNLVNEESSNEDGCWLLHECGCCQEP